MPRGFRWVTRIFPRTAVAASAQQCVDLLVPYSSVVDNLKGHTVTRIILKIVVEADGAGPVSQTHWGIALVNADAAAALAFPDAEAEQDNVRWLLRDYSDNRLSSTTDHAQLTIERYDLRAQALLRSDQEELHLIVNQNAADGILFSSMTRILLRMP